LHLGNALRASKQYAAAEASYKKALELDPTLAEARFNIGVLYIDNPLPGIDELPRLQKGLAELKEFKAKSKPDAATLKRLDEYIDATDKRIQKEVKRREREERRKREEEAAKSAPPAAAPATGNPPAGGAVPPAPGK
jgi:tetratricopeptide (TPR) repeat protein